MTTESTQLSLVDAAIGYRNAGLSPIATRGKIAVGAWKQFQDVLPTDEQIGNMFIDPGVNVAVVCGAVSGNLECIDFDDGGSALPAWAAIVEDEAPGLLDRLYAERTPSKGAHFIYRVAGMDVPVGTKLAARPNGNKQDCLIETRGAGHYVVVAPSPDYTTFQGDLANLPAITIDERNILIRAAKMLDERPPPLFEQPKAVGRDDEGSGGALKPGQDFDRRGDVADLLMRNGWKRVREAGSNQHWQRPGKTDRSTSATLRDIDGVQVLYPFSTSTPLESERGYSPFQVLATLEHNGDFTAAASALAREGYGSRKGGSETLPPSMAGTTYRPFPLASLPRPMAEYSRQAAASIGCDPAMIAAPLLTVLGAAIGNARVVQINPDWTEPPVLWTCGIANSGEKKSPALAAATFFVSEVNAEMFGKYRDDMKAFDVEATKWEADHVIWKKNRAKTTVPVAEPPAKPEVPQCRTVAVSDVTMEALAARLEENPRGLVVINDELAGWFKSMDAYRQGKGGDAAKWLSMNRAGEVRVDRKTGHKVTYVRRGFTALTGMTQPKIVRPILAGENTDSGMAARLLFVFPPPGSALVLNPAPIDPTLKDELRAIYKRLLALMPVVGRDVAIPDPVAVPLSSEAKSVFDAFRTDLHEQKKSLDDDAPMMAAIPKMEGTAARAALILHVIENEHGAPWNGTDKISRATMEAGVAIAKWFLNEARRVYADFTAQERVERNPGDMEAKLWRYVNRHSRLEYSFRELHRGAHLKPASAAEALIDRLVAEGKARWGSEGEKRTVAFIPPKDEAEE